MAMSPKRACKQFHMVRAVLTFLKCPSAIAGWCYCCRVLLRWTDTQSVQSQTFLKCPSVIAAKCYCGGHTVCAIPLYAHFPTLETANYILSPPAVPICLVHNCIIFLCSLDVRNTGDQCRGPSIKE